MTANPFLPAHHTDNNLIVHHERHSAHGLANRDVGVLGPPNDLPGLCIQRKYLAVQCAVKDLAIRVRQAARLRAAACSFDRRFELGHLRPELPLDDALPGEIERVDVVGLGRDGVHGVADHQRRGFVRIQNPELQAPRH